MTLAIIGDPTVKGEDSRKFMHYKDKLPLADFQGHLRSWFFATGIRQSYELSLADAAVAGAVVLVDFGTATFPMKAKAVVKPGSRPNSTTHARSGVTRRCSTSSVLHGTIHSKVRATLTRLERHRRAHPASSACQPKRSRGAARRRQRARALEAIVHQRRRAVSATEFIHVMS